jgi:hypothetical protein
MIRRISSGIRKILLGAGLGAATVEVAAAFLPWVRTGERQRTSFELLGSARRLGLFPSGWERSVADLWYFVPLLVAVAWLAAAAGRSRTVVAGTTLAGVAGVAVASVVQRARVPAAIGLRVTLTASLVAVLLGLAYAVGSVGRRRWERHDD